ncbi:c-type cytochrome [Hyphomicrobium facile]|uniref:Cytochrome c553 n=1 Tax=Hyphomicrobium facile TaxID=51670 RepID=A0A1I7NKL3_9HYPH|nr:cytochrome c4 [Hyphomicrobium facile]SFV35202.1 Cytochrome c553 [Hyphomicrobium facile]
MMSAKRSAQIAIAGIVAAFPLMPTAVSAASVEENAQICAGCHGENGVPQAKTTPIIWGQNEGYLYLQLRDYKSGARKNEQMSSVVAGLEKADFKALASHFAGLKWPSMNFPSPPKDVTKVALTAIGSVGCTSCHLDQFQGDGTTARLAGQQPEYLFDTMTAFRDGSRANNPGMSDLMKAVQPADLKSIAEYLASLQVVGGGQ